MSEHRAEPTLKWLGLATSLPIMTLAGAFIGYYLPISAGQPNLSTLGVIIGTLGGFLLSLVELWNYARKASKQEKQKI